MDDKQPTQQQPGLFGRIKEATQAQLDLMIAKSKASMAELSEDAIYRKSVYKDPSYAVGSQGFLEKHARMSFFYLKQMAWKNSIAAAIIQTYQNHIADFTQPVDDKHSRGFRIVLKNEKKHLDAILQELYGEEEAAELPDGVSTPEENSAQNRAVIEGTGKPADSDSDSDEAAEGDEQEGKPFGKADDEGAEAPPFGEEGEAEGDEMPEGEEGLDESASAAQLAQGDAQDAEELDERQKLREAKRILAKRISGKAQAIQDLILHCGYLEDRPFESKRWDFDAVARAWVRDSLTYDQYAMEMIEDKEDKPHHWVPVDGSTIRYATPELKNYKNFNDVAAGYDILYPEKELEALKESDALELDEEKLQADEYRYVQVVQGRIVRAFTSAELSIGMRNPMSDIYANGYSVAELELLVGIITSHIFTENYNKAYFTQGFSAKGLLHIKANIPKRKLETFRTMWNHMIKGNKNSFQTPIISGVDEVNWIPLTQNHTDIEFNLWMQYLIKVICAIYQIDPAEIGFGMRDMGQGGGSLSGDNTEVKLEQSKNRGLRPMLKHFANFINKNIIDRIDPDFKLEFVGIKDESTKETIDRQQKEAQFKKTLNEIREEDGLPPLPGCDDLVLSPIYMQWFQMFSPEGKAQQEQQREDQRQQMAQNFGTDPDEMGGGDDEGGPPDAGGQPDLPSQDVGRPPSDDAAMKAMYDAAPANRLRRLSKTQVAYGKALIKRMTKSKDAEKKRLVKIDYYTVE